MPTAAGSIQLGRWTHVAGVIDRSSATPQMLIYLDGVLAASRSIRPTPAVDVPDPLRIGSSSYVGMGNGSYDRFDGVIDEVRLWNVARSAAQIAASRNMAIATPTTGLVLRLGFDEGAGSAAADGSGNGANGSIGHLFSSTAGAIAGAIALPGQTDSYR
ncbi:MAG: LamG domain-containing protein, partial [Deltaproteobacteria bacterium]